jgi:hypothetical protein
MPKENAPTVGKEQHERYFFKCPQIIITWLCLFVRVIEAEGLGGR